MRGLMMDFPLTITHALERARCLFPAKEVITRTAAGLHRLTYADLYGRACRLANALHTIGVRDGDRIASFAWNTHRHLELYLGVPSSGAVLHTLNIRLFPEQITFIVNHAEDAVIFVDDSLVKALEPLAKELRSVRAYVVMGDGSLPETTLGPVYNYEDLLASASEDFASLVAEAVNTQDGQSLAHASVEMPTPVDRYALNNYTRFLTRKLMHDIGQTWTAGTPMSPAAPPAQTAPGATGPGAVAPPAPLNSGAPSAVPPTGSQPPSPTGLPMLPATQP